MNTKEYNPLVSIIVPVYKTEKYLKKCLNSLLDQSYDNIEIVCVNDCSPDGCAKILDSFCDGQKVVVVNHEQNKGLFNARVTGVEHCHGDYVMFVDSDDYVSVDWVRMLVQQAVSDDSDIAVGPFFFEDEKGELTYINKDILRTPVSLCGDDVSRTFITQHCTCFSWHVVWNKIYSRALWNDALKWVRQFADSHIGFTMCEDIAFSSAMWLRAKKVTNFTSGAAYYYVKHSEATTNIRAVNKTALDKKINDVLTSFEFFAQQLELFGLNQKYQKDLYLWKLYLAKDYLASMGATAHNGVYIRKKFGISPDDSLLYSDYPSGYFYDVISPVDKKVYEWGEDIKRAICSESKKVVSFDVFDTLIFRPFYWAGDLFILMNSRFNSLIKGESFVDFAKFRQEGERLCREKKHISHRWFDDVTLDEIYSEIEVSFEIPHDIAEQMKAYEVECELKWCYPRDFGKQLYQLSRHLGKKVVFTSDMYLPKNIILDIVGRNGYVCDKLYVSSELRLSKASARIFKYILKDLGVREKELIHIGDSWHSDIASPTLNGIKGYFVENTNALFECTNDAIYSPDLFMQAVKNYGHIQNNELAFDYFVGLRCAYALISHKFFDNPHKPFAQDTDFDCNPYMLGYGALGSYLLAVVNWIAERAKQLKCDKVNFVARDGYLPMLAYDMLRKYDPTLPPSNYLYISRKSLAMVDVTGPADLKAMNLKIVLLNNPSVKLCKMFEPYLSVNSKQIQKEIGYSDALFENRVLEKCECERILNVIGKYLDKAKLDANREMLKKYFSEEVTPDSLLFDIGYSGRAESALTKLLGYKIHSLYVHSNTQILLDRKNFADFDNETFYDFGPKITGVLREHMFMKLAPSTVGYEQLDGKIQPKFEKYSGNTTVDNVTRALQRGALDFVSDYYKFFGDCLKDVPYRRTDMTVLFENYMHFAKTTDRKIFNCVEFEDDLGMGKKINIFDFWTDELKRLKLASPRRYNPDEDLTDSFSVADAFIKPMQSDRIFDMPRYKRAIFYFLFEPKTFWKKLFKKHKK